MTNYNPEFIKRLAMGDQEAFAEVNKLPLLERMSIGNAIDEMRRNENIIPVDGGKMSIYEQKKSSLVDDDAVRASMQKMMDQRKTNEEFQAKAREEFILEQTRQAVERGRAGLTRNDRLSK